jgi:hypothetical protein
MKLPDYPNPATHEQASAGILRYSVFALLLGVIFLGVSYALGNREETVIQILLDLLKEFGIILICIFGISYMYEVLSKKEQFQRFYRDLQNLMREGESNAAMCASLGILEIHASRRSFEERHSFAQKVDELEDGDRIRIFGRSLMFTMFGWEHLSKILKKGARLELCICDPAIENTPLSYLSGYSHEETLLTVHRFVNGMKPWVLKEKPLGTMEIRMHDIHLLDSFVEIDQGESHVAVWDLNFGQGVEARRVFVLDRQRGLGRDLSVNRYDILWTRATHAFEYVNTRVQLDIWDTKSAPHIS